MRAPIAVLAVLAALATPMSAEGQLYKYYTPGSVWNVQLIRVKYGQDQNLLAYLDGTFKKFQDANVKAGVLKSYKILRAFDDEPNSWNVLIMYEYPSLAAMEASAQKEDSIITQVFGTEQSRTQASDDRTKFREIVGGKLLRELILK